MIRFSIMKIRVVLIGATLLAVLAFINSEPELEVMRYAEKVELVTTTDLISDTQSKTLIDMPPKETLPSSLKGTSHGVTLTVHQDNLVITSSLKDLFDYYLSASGEETIAQISQRVALNLSSQLTTLALNQALTIWQDYISYKTALVQLDQQYSASDSALDKYQHLQLLQQRQLSLIALQDQIFSESIAQILFSFDRNIDNHTLEKARILASDLSGEAKQQSLINLDAQLPIEVIVSKKRNQKQKRLIEIDDIDGLTSEQKYSLRAQQVGEAAANRLQQLDEKRQLWKQRINEFILQKQQLLDAELAAEDYIISLEELYQQNFAAAEQLRAKALTH
jgi:lipase chaperone LimK